MSYLRGTSLSITTKHLKLLKDFHDFCFIGCVFLLTIHELYHDRDQRLNYAITPGDEVEDLFILLNEVKQQIPSITAVSSGAIASDYQRLRVESVCSRLGLVSLAYLWKQDQTFLLTEMVIFKFIFLNPYLVKLLVIASVDDDGGDAHLNSYDVDDN